MQSAAMALAFGSFFQYGKRKISAMGNDEFNILTPEMLASDLSQSVSNMIPSAAESFKQMETMNIMVLDSMAKYFDQSIQYLDKWIKGGQKNLTNNLGLGEFTGDDIPDYIPTAGADETGSTGNYTDQIAGQDIPSAQDKFIGPPSS